MSSYECEMMDGIFSTIGKKIKQATKFTTSTMQKAINVTVNKIPGVKHVSDKTGQAVHYTTTKAKQNALVAGALGLGVGIGTGGIGLLLSPMLAAGGVAASTVARATTKPPLIPVPVPVKDPSVQIPLQPVPVSNSFAAPPVYVPTSTSTGVEMLPTPQPLIPISATVSAPVPGDEKSSNIPLIIGGVLVVGAAAFFLMRKKSPSIEKGV